MTTKARPILFSGPMVRAILEGRKTQTRRVVKEQHRLRPGLNDLGVPAPQYLNCYGSWQPWIDNAFTMRAHHGRPEQLLWVRESWDVCQLVSDPTGERISRSIDWSATDQMMCWDSVQRGLWHLAYRADGEDAHEGRWRPSIHMPRWASRLTLRITAVRVERLQAMHRGDAMAEGCPFPNMADGPDPLDWFRALWDSLNAKRGHGWDTNPWVWVYDFEPVPTPISAATPEPTPAPTGATP